MLLPRELRVPNPKSSGGFNESKPIVCFSPGSSSRFFSLSLDFAASFSPLDYDWGHPTNSQSVQAIPITRSEPQQAQIRICENPDGTYSLQTRDGDSDWHPAYEGADALSRAEALYAMELWRNGLGYARARDSESCGDDQQ